MVVPVLLDMAPHTPDCELSALTASRMSAFDKEQVWPCLCCNDSDRHCNQKTPSM